MKIIDNKFISLLQTLSLNLSIKLKNNKLGKKHSSAKGSSVEFSDYREYSFGDDFRRIDWASYARFEKLFLKLYTEEQQASISIFLDSSKSMGFEKKREAGIKLAALFSFTSLNEYDKVSLMFFDEKINTKISNINTKQGFYKIANLLEEQEFNNTCNLYDSVKEAMPSLKKGASIIISDFLYEHKLDEVLKALNFKGQKIIICHVLNDDELGVTYNENIRLKDSETSEELNIDINDKTVELYNKNLNKYLNEIQAIATKHNASYFLINASKGIEEFIMNLNKIS